MSRLSLWFWLQICRMSRLILWFWFQNCRMSQLTLWLWLQNCRMSQLTLWFWRRLLRLSQGTLRPSDSLRICFDNHRQTNLVSQSTNQSVRDCQKESRSVREESERVRKSHRETERVKRHADSVKEREWKRPLHYCPTLGARGRSSRAASGRYTSSNETTRRLHQKQGGSQRIVVAFTVVSVKHTKPCVF